MLDTSLEKEIEKQLNSLNTKRNEYRFSKEKNKPYLHQEISELEVRLKRDIEEKIDSLKEKKLYASFADELIINNKIKFYKTKLESIQNSSYSFNTNQNLINDIKDKLSKIASYRESASSNELIKLTIEEEKLLNRLKELEPDLFSLPKDNTTGDSFSNSYMESKLEESVNKITNNNSFFDNKLSEESNMIVNVSSTEKQTEKTILKSSRTDILPANKASNPNFNGIDIINKCRNVIALLNKNDYRSKILVDIQESLDQCEKEYNKPDESNSLWKIAVVGQFSCGKSSFINSLIGEDIEPTEPPPVNHANTLFTYGENLTIKSGLKSFSLEDYKKEVEKENSPYKKFIIKYPSEVLKNIELWDTPGIGSVNKTENESKENRDKKLSLEAAQKSDIVFYLIAIKDGTILDSDLDYIKDINNEKKVYLILTHLDKKSPKARENIKEEIIKQIVSNNIRINIENIFLYSSNKDKCLKSKDLSEYRNKVLALLNSFPKKEIKKCDNQKLKRELKASFDCLKDYVNNRKKEEKNDLLYSSIDKANDEFNRNVYDYAKHFVNANPRLIEVNKNQILAYKSTSFINHTVILNAQLSCFIHYTPNKDYFSKYNLEIIKNVIFEFCEVKLNQLKSDGVIADSWTVDGAKEEIDKAIKEIQKKYYYNQESIVENIYSLIKRLEAKEKNDYRAKKVRELIYKELSTRWEKIDDYLEKIDNLLL